jgi:CheY-like chemotaxis protein
MNIGHILIIEDEEHIVELIKFNLENNGYKVSFATDGQKGLELIESEQPDLVLLDLMLPKVDGIDICNRVKNNKNLKEIPIIMLTAKSGETDKIIGLEIGADDYITKPFSVRELLARIKVVLRRYQTTKNNHLEGSLTIDDLVIDIDKINQQSKALLMVSLVYPTDDHRKIFEPLASSVEKRLEMIQQFKARNIPVCVLAMPLLPRISDDPISVNNLFDKLSSLKVDAVMPGSLTLRPGRQKEHYLNTIKSSYPELLDFYQELYKNNSYSGSPEKWYVNKTLPMVYTALKERNLPTLLPHSIYKGSYPKYDELYFLLKHMKLLYRYNNVSIEPLKRAESSYSNWYIKNRSLFNRRRSMTQEEFEHLLWSELDNTYPTILNGNRKLTNFVKQAIFEDQTFDYIKLKLI